jgi:hypothetical protein
MRAIREAWKFCLDICRFPRANFCWFFIVDHDGQARSEVVEYRPICLARIPMATPWAGWTKKTPEGELECLSIRLNGPGSSSHRK